MSYSAPANVPIVVNLLVACNDTGWSVDGSVANHSSCNAGSITLDDYPVSVGYTYRISYIMPNISGGYLQAQTPGSNGAMQTTPGLYVESLTPTSNGFLS